MKPIRIMLADDHTVVREGIRALLETESDLQVVGQASDGVAAIAQAEQLKPDVLLVDLMMPGLNGLDVMRAVRHRCPKTRMVALSMHADDAYVLEALRNGAVGYVLKESGIDDLLYAIRTVVSGHRYLSPRLAERAIESYWQRAQTAAHDAYETLSLRERQVLHMAVENLSNPEIGKRLSISPRTAEKHRSKAMRKLGLRNELELIRFALRRGIISLQDASLPGQPESPPKNG